MGYTRYDFSESLERAAIKPGTIQKVILAWGDSPEDYRSWEGAFVLAMKGGGYLLLSGWCDTSGWGCRDGVTTVTLSARPTLQSLRRLISEGTASWDRDYWLPPDDAAWDEEPGDLNRWLESGAKGGDLWSDE